MTLDYSARFCPTLSEASTSHSRFCLPCLPEEDGQGVYVDFSMLEGMLSLMPQPIIDFTLNRKEWNRVGNRDAVKVPHGIYRCIGDDQWIAISVGSQAEWRRFCAAIGTQEWARIGVFWTN